ncbi:MAG: acyl-CoA dehydrogenase family protein [Planctomycetes bacterium]|nr:acyl-CoA dehydrogenase family protein [Planctomycetota bacterium]
MSSEYRGVDFYAIDDLLTEEQRLVRDTVRDFVSEQVCPIIAEHARAGTFPHDLTPKMGEINVFGANLPEEYGCAGLDNISYGLIMQELERGDSGVRSFASVQGALVMYPIFKFGTEAQKRKWLPQLAKGSAIGCFGLTEPDHGSDPAGMTTRATRKGAGWVVHGNKMWITNGTLADVAVVWAQTEDGIQGFLLEKGMKGFSAPEMKGKLSLRASVTSELVMDHVEVPEENRLPNVKGLKGPLSCLTQARYGIAWGAVGAAQGVFDEAVNYAKSRIQFGKPIASFQLNQRKFADMVTEITKAQLVVWRLGKLKDDGKMTPQQVSLAKRNNVKIALDAARTCREILGANGILDEYTAMRHAANLESVHTYEGTYEIHTLVLGAAVTGIDAYR